MANDLDAQQSSLDCTADPVGSLQRLFVDMTMGPRIARGQCPVQRPVFLKPHAVARAQLTIQPELPEALGVGLFAEARTYDAWIRVSSDTVPSLPDLGTTVGVGIKLFDVPGSKLIGNPSDTTFDLVFQNHDVFFVDTAFDMCAFTKASFEGKDAEYLAAHPVTDAVLKDMQKVVPSALETPYWSVLPYAFGAKRYVKYKLEPQEAPPGSGNVDRGDPNYLAIDLRERMMKGPTRFRLLVQLQTDEAAMPLDRATVRWSETDSEPIQVATLTIPAQDITARGQSEYGENLAINPWRVTEQHTPQGSLAAVRRVVYAAAADLRHTVNGVPDGEPVHPRELGAFPPARDTTVVSAKIHPAIGIARVGNAPSEFFIGPETTTPAPAETGKRRDKSHALMRQAARFRIYGYNKAGEVVRELSPNNARIEWQVQLANLKASWYQFQIALDIPEAVTAPPSLARNQGFANRSALGIVAPLKAVSGTDAQAAICEGSFDGQTVYLGELTTDAAGRLIVLGGRGKAGSLPNTPITTFANNDGWHDDVSDGPVTATVKIDGKDIPVDPAWVVVGPPNYAPDLKGVRTLYDLLRDVFIEAGSLPMPNAVSFIDDVLPVFERLAGLQWVNAGYASAFGHGGTLDLMSAALVAKLADESDANKAFRFEIFNTFRDFDKDSWSPSAWPWLYGDAMEVQPFASTPRQNVMLAKHQLFALRRWAEGKFKNDWSAGRKTFLSIDDVPLAAQPAMLDRAALEFCLADAFHPGCELTWPMRHTTMYMAPFRVRHRRSDEKSAFIGDALSPAEALAFGGPLYGQRAGWLTRWMAVPWHTDTASCRSQAAYDPTYNPFVPTFWPARVPNQVLSEEAHAAAVDTSLPRAQRLSALNQRGDWIDRTLGETDYLHQIVAMIERYGEMGLVMARKGVDGDPEFPPVMYVSDGKDAAAMAAMVAGAVPGQPPATPIAFTERLGNFPFGPR
jgi:hypothetical protein